jgi:hypothetical protein
MPASKLHGDETIIGNGMDHKSPASWPQTSANIAAADSTLPVPDPSTFEPDTLPSQDTADIQWPAEPELTAEPAKRHASSERSRRHMAQGMTRHAKEERRAERAHPHQQHAHSHAAVDRNHADMMSRMKSLTAMFAPYLAALPV